MLKPLGQIVEVDKAKMSLYTEGSGPQTLVFLSGSGTSSPILDFRSLYDQLSDQYKIVVVERVGYGFSDISKTNRDLDTVLEHTRKALEVAQIEGPLVLVPHSMSGIEALYWAQKYPTEVSAIVGLDISTPKAYRNMNFNIPLMHVLKFGADIGITRLGSISESDAITNGTLTEHEKSIYRAVFFTRTMTSDMTSELKNIKEGSEKVKALDILNFQSCY